MCLFNKKGINADEFCSHSHCQNPNAKQQTYHSQKSLMQHHGKMNELSKFQSFTIDQEIYTGYSYKQYLMFVNNQWKTEEINVQRN